MNRKDRAVLTAAPLAISTVSTLFRRRSFRTGLPAPQGPLSRRRAERDPAGPRPVSMKAAVNPESPME